MEDYDKEIEIICSLSSCTEEDAKKAYNENDGDVVSAIFVISENKQEKSGRSGKKTKPAR